MGAVFEIVIDALPNGSTVNSRGHWKRRDEMARVMREEARALAMLEWHGRPPLEPPVVLEILYGVPNLRRRDLDNLVSASKSWLDGIVDAGVIGDDDVTHIPTLRAQYVLSRNAGFTRIRLLQYDA